MILTIEVEVQEYNGEEEEFECLEAIRAAIVAVVGLCDLAVGTFVKTHITGEKK